MKLNMNNKIRNLMRLLWLPVLLTIILIAVNIAPIILLFAIIAAVFYIMMKLGQWVAEDQGWFKEQRAPKDFSYSDYYDGGFPNSAIPGDRIIVLATGKVLYTFDGQTWVRGDQSSEYY